MRDIFASNHNILIHDVISHDVLRVSVPMCNFLTILGHNAYRCLNITSTLTEGHSPFVFLTVNIQKCLDFFVDLHDVSKYVNIILQL